MAFRRRIGAVLGKVFPSAVEEFRGWIRHRHFRRRFGAFLAEVARRLYEDKQIEVLTGPFQGLLFVNITGWGTLTSRWLGCYEAELHPWIEAAVGRGYQRIINIGCAEGYYACGFAQRLRSAEVF